MPRKVQTQKINNYMLPAFIVLFAFVLAVFFLSRIVLINPKQENNPDPALPKPEPQPVVPELTDTRTELAPAQNIQEAPSTAAVEEPITITIESNTSLPAMNTENEDTTEQTETVAAAPAPETVAVEAAAPAKKAKKAAAPKKKATKKK